MWKEGTRNKLLGSAIKTRLKFFRGSEQGMSLIEVLVALAILGAVAVVFLIGLTTSSKAAMASQNRVVAESLAKSQMENIKSSTYDDVNDQPNYETAKLTDIPDGYDINISAVRLDADPALPPDDPDDDDDGIQEITVTVTHNGEAALTIASYKVR
jgi:prepilin-type N-terminal cleavage/methylation domain-containing protein